MGLSVYRGVSQRFDNCNIVFQICLQLKIKQLKFFRKIRHSHFMNIFKKYKKFGVRNF